MRTEFDIYVFIFIIQLLIIHSYIRLKSKLKPHRPILHLMIIIML